MAVNPAGTRVYVTNYNSNSVSVLDSASNTVTATVAVGSSPSALGLFIGGPPETAVAVEYYYADWNFYFMTSFPDEIAALDGGAFGGVFNGPGKRPRWPQTNPRRAAYSPLFQHGVFAPKSSWYFRTPFAPNARSSGTELAWEFEAIAFYIQLADANGLCSGGTIPLYRLYNDGIGGR